ncbi:MAG TPA: hypothetical protein VFY23_08625, partial [Candidatus Limnocylindrales bacterium]|nr:hypothetical protein [Candidatus Limnocylindrales bacterium]
TATAETGATLPLTAGSTYCVSSLVRDDAGLVSAWSAETCTAVPLDDRSLTRSSGWTAGTGSAYYRGTYLRTTRLGAKLTRTDVRARRLSLVATTCPTCGSVKVYWGSTFLKTVSLRSTTTMNQRVLPLATFSSARTGTVTIKVVSSARRVTIDGLVVKRN